MTIPKTEIAAPAVDIDELLGRCLGNLAFAERILAVFQQRCSSDLDELERAIESEDLECVASIAHRLKGACANAAAHALCERTSQLRQAACDGDAQVVSENYQELKTDWADFVATVPELQWRTDVTPST